ncbi:MAG: hypothetical protein AAGN66_24930 [Acidobacteriota bacterium]
MSDQDDKAPEALELERDGLEQDDELVEVDWGPIQAALDGMAEEGLDLDDYNHVANHMAVMLGAFLRQVQADGDIEEETLAEMAAELAAFAVDLAVGEDELPPFAPSSEHDA